jgi:hypothetical protein
LYIILHPNYVEDFYNIINELYRSEDMYYLAERLVFNPMKTSISSKSDELDQIKKEYLSLCDDFKEEMNFNPKKIFITLKINYLKITYIYTTLIDIDIYLVYIYKCSMSFFIKTLD